MSSSSFSSSFADRLGWSSYSSSARCVRSSSEKSRSRTTTSMNTPRRELASKAFLINSYSATASELISSAPRCSRVRAATLKGMRQDGGKVSGIEHRDPTTVKSPPGGRGGPGAVQRQRGSNVTVNTLIRLLTKDPDCGVEIAVLG